MSKVIFYLIFCVYACFSANGQATETTKSKKSKTGFLYLAAGSQRIFFTPSNIRVIRPSAPSFDFTLAKVKAKDEGGLKFDTAPQFSYTIGYYFTKKKFGLEYQYDHVKYFVQQYQVVHLKGTINGNSYDKDTLINPDFFQLEHSDGANYAMVNLVKWIPLSLKQKKSPELMIKGGIGIVNPKTNSTILGNERDDRYYLSGYIVGFESGFRFHLGKYLFATGTFKGAFANYNHFLIAGGYGKQKWLSGQFNYLIGGQFPL
jgi:hypothetical protein